MCDTKQEYRPVKKKKIISDWKKMHFSENVKMIKYDEKVDSII